MTRARFFSVLYVFVGMISATIAAAAERPNIVLCMADDQGWGDVSYYGHKVLKTPVLDEMAASGLRLDRFYAAAPVCSPTRGSVMTGRHPNRFGCFSWGHTLRPQEITIAEALQHAGYATGHFGKWHLGPVRKASPVSPGHSGFDEWVSSPNFYENSPLLSHNGKVIETKGESSRVTVDYALKFMKQSAAKKKPFLAVIWFGNPHTPHVALPEFKKPFAAQKVRMQNYAGEIAGIDAAMGHLRRELRALGVAGNTLLWYTSDNGSRPPGSTGGLRGMKGSLYEGGIRVPTIIEWPVKITSSRTTSLPSGTIDIYPTVLDIVGVKTAHQPRLDGISLRPLIEGNMKTRSKPMGFWVYPVGGIRTPSAQWMKELQAEQAAGTESTDPQKLAADAGKITKKYPLENPPGHAALIDGDYKLHRIPKKNGNIVYELYNLKSDPQEKTDLAEKQADITARLKKSLAAWQTSVLHSLNGDDYAKE